MEDYDPNKRYFGPQGSQLCKVIPEYPPTVPQLKGVFNRSGYNHDKGFTGKRRKGFFGWLKDAWERWGIDDRFLEDMQLGIEAALMSGEITEDQAEIAHAYAKLAHKSVRAAGWTFFRTGEEDA